MTIKYVITLVRDVEIEDYGATDEQDLLDKVREEADTNLEEILDNGEYDLEIARVEPVVKEVKE